MSSPSSTGRDGHIAKLEGNSTKAAIVIDLDKLNFLDLPAELRFMIYAYFTPEDQYIFPSNSPAYDGLLRTCKQIRKEAQKETQKAADKYYRAYEARWLLEEGFCMKVEPIIDPGKIVVVLSGHPFTTDALNEWGHLGNGPSIHIPLASLNLQRLTFKISLDASVPTSGVLGRFTTYWAIFRLLMSILRSKLQAQRIYFHRGTNLSRNSITDFRILCTVISELWFLDREQEDVDARYKWSLTANVDDSPDTVHGIWIDRITG